MLAEVLYSSVGKSFDTYVLPLERSSVDIVDASSTCIVSEGSDCQTEGDSGEQFHGGCATVSGWGPRADPETKPRLYIHATK